MAIHLLLFAAFAVAASAAPQQASLEFNDDIRGAGMAIPLGEESTVAWVSGMEALNTTGYTVRLTKIAPCATRGPYFNDLNALVYVVEGDDSE